MAPATRARPLSTPDQRRAELRLHRPALRHGKWRTGPPACQEPRDAAERWGGRDRAGRARWPRGTSPAAASEAGASPPGGAQPGRGPGAARGLQTPFSVQSGSAVSGPPRPPVFGSGLRQRALAVPLVPLARQPFLGLFSACPEAPATSCWCLLLAFGSSKMNKVGKKRHSQCPPNAQSIFIVLLTIDDNSFLLQQKYSHISCFWEKQPSGCVRISCAFHHSKPRSINGLFLPPNNNVPLQEGGQERTLHPAHLQASLRNQENIFLPVHAPLIISLNKGEDEQDDAEDDDKENYVSNCVPKTAAEMEEERTIKEICYKTGEYYRIQYPHEHQSAETVSSPQEKEILLLEAMERDLQKGDGNTIPTTFSNTKREGESSGRRVPAERMPRRNWRSFDNGGIHSSDPNVKPSYQQWRKNKDDETAASVPYVRGAGRKTDFDSLEPRRSTYVFYRTMNVTPEPKFNGSTDKCTSGFYNAPRWRKRNPRENAH
ncbi:uncharacterized protein C12orf50 homolog [Patagioenas fasciata]|uniref:uncharacterized protein C12orf50 homolog n=1 Tax=Patagioenas fasciata TaxID=372321 RepID=UPI003A9A3413